MIPLPPWAYALAAAAVVSGAFAAGWTVNGWRHEAKQADALTQAYRGFVEATARTNTIATDNAQDEAAARDTSYDRQTTIRTIYRTIEVPVACEPDPAAVGLLEQAVADANARASGEPVAALPAAP